MNVETGPDEAPVTEAAPALPALPAPPAPAAPAEAGLSPAECAAKLAELFPALFVAPAAPGPVKPIKLRIHADIHARAPGLFSKRVLGIFFSRYTTTTAYLKALVAPGATRFDLDGQPAGEIAQEHRDAAEQELARRQAIVAERRAMQRRSAPVPPRDEQAPKAEREEPGERRRPPSRPHAMRREPQRERPSRPHRTPMPRQSAPDAPLEPAAALPLPADPAQRERAQLLRSFESSPLSKANFCALKRLSQDELDTQLALAREERGVRKV